jgi:subtilisin family serine protease
VRQRAEHAPGAVADRERRVGQAIAVTAASAVAGTLALAGPSRPTAHRRARRGARGGTNLDLTGVDPALYATTFFTADSTLDRDTQPNFFGTSAAAPHAAAIAALARQARGRLSPDAMRALLERSAFPHDSTSSTAGEGGGR